MKADIYTVFEVIPDRDTPDGNYHFIGATARLEMAMELAQKERDKRKPAEVLLWSRRETAADSWESQSGRSQYRITRMSMDVYPSVP